MHPDCHGDAITIERLKEMSLEQRNKHLQLIERLSADGRLIGKSELQPSWCPLLRDKQNE